MKSSHLVAYLLTLALCLLLTATTSTNATAVGQQHRDDKAERDLDHLSRDELYARALQGSVDSDVLLALEKRQIAAGGGSGVLTTYTGVQTISGYTPPPSRPIPTPTPSGGTIISPSQIPGYGNSSSTGGGSASPASSSHALSQLLATTLAIAAAVGAGWAFI